jgi:beta-glucosidase
MPTAFATAVARVEAGADPHAEAQSLVAQMTLEEKLGCLDGDTPFWEGLIDGIQGGYYEHPYPAARVPRLGVPGIAFSDGPRGVVVGHATAFPVSMARGATFDPALEERVGDAIGRELRAVGATFYGGVCVNLLRHPGWGRAQETYGEDPLHVGAMGAALARGVQRHAMACVKHFACNSIENARFKVDVTVDERALHEVYLPHFRTVVEAGVASVMSAYNAVNGEWCGQHHELLTRILREEWGFRGIVVSDFQFGLRDPVRSVEAGLDIEMPYVQQRAQRLPAAVADGTLAVEVVDRAVTRIMATLLRFARVLESAGDSTVLACDAHRALAREVAAHSLVLLRNEGGVLPLDPGRIGRLAVIGRLAAVPNLGDRGSSDVHPPHVVTPLEGLRAALSGVDVAAYDGADLRLAAAAAAEHDVAVVVVGCTHRDEGEYVDQAGVAHLYHLFPPMPDAETGERLREALRRAAAGKGMSSGGDRRHLGLSAADEALVLAVARANPRTVVVVMSGSAVVMERWRDRVPAIVQLWYPGMEGGHALGDVLLGRVNPSGRLPFAVPTAADHLPAFEPDATAVTYDLWHGQWKLDRDAHPAAYPFGFGLSYTRFELRDAAASGDGPERRVRCTVANMGGRDGAEVVQVYGGLPGSRYERPSWRLLGFARVEVPAAASRTIEIPISLRTLAVRERGTWVLEPGRYAIAVGRHAGDPGALRLEVVLA